jgi:hypothetical protein
MSPDDFGRGEEVSVAYRHHRFTAMVQDSRAAGRARGVLVVNPGASPFQRGRFLSVPVSSLSARPPTNSLPGAQAARLADPLNIRTSPAGRRHQPGAGNSGSHDGLRRRGRLGER